MLRIKGVSLRGTVSSSLPPAPGKQDFCWQCRDKSTNAGYGPAPAQGLATAQCSPAQPSQTVCPEGQAAQPHYAAETNDVRVCCPHCANVGRRTMLSSVQCSLHPTPQSPLLLQRGRICPQGTSEPYESADPAQPSSVNTTETFLLGWTEQHQGLQAEILMNCRKNIKFFLSRIPWEKQRNG